MRVTLTHLTFVVLLCAGSLAGCEDACSSLSEQICRCESTQTGQQACLQRLNQRTGAINDPSPEQLEVCEALMDTCDCQTLANGDYAACGLAVE